jgi:hypothetical protein
MRKQTNRTRRSERRRSAGNHSGSNPTNGFTSPARDFMPLSRRRIAR